LADRRGAGTLDRGMGKGHWLIFGLTLNLSNINELNSLRIKKGKAGASKERVDGATAHIDQPKETTEKRNSFAAAKPCGNVTSDK